MFTNNLYTCFDTTNSNMYFVNKIKYQITMNISLTAIEMLSIDRYVFFNLYYSCLKSLVSYITKTQSNQNIRQKKIRKKI